ncbi:Uncharacterized protein DAT39_011750 [Clarias magur]|uniref:Uncharacterized protein n=1 Tax=Clarias magur TaxID=1594786 RepID=A0A8J4X2I2_CLAMG|nr:Uncharacterized protein DAT39_011750 [Clarias magur]
MDAVKRRKECKLTVRGSVVQSAANKSFKPDGKSNQFIKVLDLVDFGGVWVIREEGSTTIKIACGVKPASLTLHPLPLMPSSKIFLGRH